MSDLHTPAELAATYRVAAPEGTTPPGRADSTLVLAMVPLADLRIDARYQRKVSESSRSRILKMLRGFRWGRFGALIVSRIGPDACAVIDGQHRAIAAAALGVAQVPCVVITADTAEQAGEFVGVNSVRTTVASVDRFRARVAAGEQEALDLDEILRDLGISYDVPAGAALKPRQTRAVAQLERLIRRIGKGMTFTVLECMLDAQPDDPNLLCALNINATAMALERVTAAEGDVDRLVDVLRETDFETLASGASQMVKLQGGQRFARAADLLMHDYNRNLRRKIT